MSELGPAQLDRIEDALELLEHDGLPPALLDDDEPGADAVRERLEAYRRILVLSRDALPMQEVPAEILDDVLAQARAEAAEAPPEPVQPEREPWWKRFKATIVLPLVAVAASAVAVLWLARPAGEAADTATIARNEAQRTPGAPAPMREQAARPAPVDTPVDGRAVIEQGLADASVEEARDEQDEVTALEGESTRRGGGTLLGGGLPPRTEPVEESDLDKGGLRRSKAPRHSSARSSVEPGATPTTRSPNDAGPSGGAAPAPPAEPKPKAPAQEKKRAQAQKKTADDSAPEQSGGLLDGTPDPWSLVQQGDALRHKGSCSAARAKYQAVDPVGDDRARARALAGIGLCERRAGRDPGKWFARARKLDASVQTFIDGELGDGGDAVPQAQEQADVSKK